MKYPIGTIIDHKAPYGKSTYQGLIFEYTNDNDNHLEDEKYCYKVSWKQLTNAKGEPATWTGEARYSEKELDRYSFEYTFPTNKTKEDCM